MASRSFADLDGRLVPLAYKFESLCKEAGIDIIFTCTYRSNEEQAAAYAQGRTKSGRIITDAKPGESKHNIVDAARRPSSQAFDVVPIVNGKCDWDANDPVWQKLGEIGESLGLEWAGRWVHFKEYPHFQLKEAA